MLRKQNPHIRRGLYAFVIMSASYELLALFMYGLFLRVKEVYPVQEDLTVAVCLALLVLVGFGLMQTYIQETSLSGLGFTLLITAICFQHFFLMNAFWSKAGIQQSDTHFMDVNKLYDKLMMGDNSISAPVNYSPYGVIPPGLVITSLGATVWNAFKACLCIVVSFTPMLGRGGPMEAFLLCLFGVIFYELNVQVISRFAYDRGGSMTIFVFGGCLGFFASLVMTNARNAVMLGHERYKTSKLHAVLALVGTLFVWTLFPALVSQGTVFTSTTTPLVYNAMKFAAVINVVYALTGSAIMSIASSLMFRDKLSVRDVIQGSIAGGVAVVSSAGIITKPVGGLVIGIVAGFLHVLYLNKLDKRMNSKFIIDTSGAFSMFVLSGVQGGIWSAVFTAFQTVPIPKVTFDTGYSLPFSTGGGQMGALATSIAISSLTGTLIGLILKFSNKNNEDDQFLDATYWVIEDDGICYRDTSPTFQNTFVESQVHIRQEPHQQDLVDPRRSAISGTDSRSYY